MCRKISSYAIIMTLFALSCCYANDDNKETALYQSVLATELLDKDTLISRNYKIGKSPDFIIDGNTLYLKIQTTHNERNMYIVADTQVWNSSKLNVLVKNNPQLKNFFPNSNLSNKGVAWLYEKP